MLTTIIITVFFAILLPIVQLISLTPDVSNITSIGQAVTTASEYLTGLNSFLPVTTLLEILSVVLLFESSYFAFKIIYWVIKRIPTQS